MEDFSYTIHNQEQMYHALYDLPLPYASQCVQKALQDPVFCDRVLLKVFQFAILETNLFIEFVNRGIDDAIRKTLIDPEELVSFLKKRLLEGHCNYRYEMSDHIFQDLLWEPIVTILKPQNKMDSTDQLLASRLLIMSSIILIIAAKWLPESCVEKMFPDYLGVNVLKRIGKLSLQNWALFCPETIPVLLKLSMDPHVKHDKAQSTLLGKIIIFEVCEQQHATSNIDARASYYIPLLLSYGANPNFSLFFTGQLGLGWGMFSLLKIWMISGNMMIDHCTAHDIDIALSFMQYGAKKIVTNESGQNILEIIYEKYPAIKGYIQSQGIVGKKAVNPHVVFDRISIACLRREIQYASSLIHRLQNQYLNLLILLADERFFNHPMISALGSLPFEILFRILRYLDFETMHKTHQEGEALVKAVFSNFNQIKAMLKTPGGVSVFQQNDKHYTRFTFFKSAKILAQDYYRLKSKLQPHPPIGQKTSFFGKAKKKLQSLYTKQVDHDTDVTRHALVQFEVFATVCMREQLSLYNKPESKVLLLANIDDAPWVAAEIK